MWYKTYAMAHAEDVGINRHCLASERHCKHYIRCFTAYTGQGDHFIHCLRNYTIETFTYHSCHLCKML